MVLRKHKYVQLDPDHYDNIMRKYTDFIDALNDVNIPPVKVFQPLTQKTLDELQLIREVSKNLQQKKEEDMKKAAQAAMEVEEVSKVQEEEATETKKEE